MTKKVARRVSAYWNTHKKNFSLLNAEGKVINKGDKTTVFSLYNVQPVIHRAAQTKSYETGVKTVHAFLRGWLLPDSTPDVERYANEHPIMHTELLYDWRDGADWYLYSPTFTAMVAVDETSRFNRVDFIVKEDRPKVYVCQT